MLEPHPTLQHPKLHPIVASRVFENVSNFDQLQENIKNISSAGEVINPSVWKGDVFEVFCEALILLVPNLQAKRVWSKSSLIPPKIANRLRLRPKDKGVDGLIETIDGNFITYQAKYFTTRNKLWYGDLGQFFGLSDHVDGTLILSNCTELDEETKDREPQFYSYSDLKELPENQWFSIISLLNGTKPRARKPLCRDPHQKRAVRDCVYGLREHDRLQYISACGTGKTLSSLWIAEKYKPKTVLYLVPSLALLQQTLSEWINHSDATFPFLSVCSDKKTIVAAEDVISLSQSDLPFKVTTEPKKILNWFGATNCFDFRVVFATYDSAKKVSAGSPAGFSFDLAFFDEAHKTAGRVGKKFTYALLDENLACEKRIFMTATPKIIKLRNEIADELSSVSMDNLNIYGPVKHKLSFSEATKQGIIVPFKILISQVDATEIEEEKRRISVTEVEDEMLLTEHVSHQVALKHLQEHSKCKKILTFHRKVKDAELFVEHGPLGIEQHLPAFKSFSVKGALNTEVRKNILKEFSESDFGIVSNAKCLTEGVDVPEIDLVYFSHPKKSAIDIAQAVGRAIRKPRVQSSKRCGYVAIPLFLERNRDESLEAAVARTDFTNIAEVINSLRGHDDELAEIITDLRVAKGRGRGGNYSPLESRIEFVTGEIKLDALKDFILAKIVDQLTPSWDEWFGQLINYLELHGRAPSIEGRTTRLNAGQTLGDWCGQQRTKYNLRTLSDDRLSKLNSLAAIGWTWDPIKDRMIEMSLRVREYCNEFELFHIQDAREHNGAKVGQDCKTLRQSFATGNLPQEAKDILESIEGWVWREVDNVIWNLKFERYKRVVLEENIIIPNRDRIIEDVRGIEPYGLGNWINQQTSKYLGKKNGVRILTNHQIARFEAEIPFWAWTAWDRSFGAYKTALGRLGEGNVRVNTVCEDFPEDLKNVGRWLSKQRTHCRGDNFTKSSKLKIKKLLLLEKTSFICDPQTIEWHQTYNSIVFYVLKNNTSRVSQDFVTNNGSALGAQVSTLKNKTKPEDFDGILKRLTLEELPNWFENWADKRTVDYLPTSDSHIRQLSKAFQGHKELSSFLVYAIFAGIRLSELHKMKQKTFDDINVIEIPKSKGVAGFRRIPIHKNLVNKSSEFKKTKAALKKAFSDRKPNGFPKEISDTSLHLRFLDELKSQNISYKLKTLLIYGGDHEEWNSSIVQELKEKIDRVNYPIEFEY